MKWLFILFLISFSSLHATENNDFDDFKKRLPAAFENGDEVVKFSNLIHSFLEDNKKIPSNYIFSLRNSLHKIIADNAVLQELSTGQNQKMQQITYRAYAFETALKIYYSLMRSSPKLRTFTRDQFTDPGAQLTGIREFLWFNLHPDIYKKLEKDLQKVVLINDENSLLQKTIPFNLVNRGIRFSSVVPEHAPGLLGVRDSAVDLWTGFSNFVSGNYGNVAGKIKWRDGYLSVNKEALTKFKNALFPLDIIVNKTGNKFTDLNIPGNFGHAAVYLGTKEQLIELNLWNQDELIPFHKEIESGKVIMEMTRHGIDFATLEETLEADEVAVMRVNLSYKNEINILERYRHALLQKGKKYDFNFDANTTTRITCTEFVSQIFDFLPWNANLIFGRNAIVPDDIVKMLHPDIDGEEKLEFVLYLKASNSVKAFELKKSSLLKAIE